MRKTATREKRVDPWAGARIVSVALELADGDLLVLDVEEGGPGRMRPGRLPRRDLKRKLAGGAR